MPAWVEGVEVDVGHAAVEADGLVGQRQRERDGDVGGMMPSLRAATAMRVWQRQSMEWMAAVLAAEPTAMPRSMSRRLQVGPANSSSAESSRSGLGGVEELGAGGVAAGAAVVVGWVPVGEADEQDGVDGFGDVGVAEPDRLAAFLAAGAHPLGELRGGCRRRRR